MPHFLVADDSPHKTAMLKDLLAIARWKDPILFAATSEEAMRLIDHHPDIAHAFVDYYIPSANGPAIIRYLKEKNPAARISLVSSSGKQPNLEEALVAGAEACVNTSERSDIVERTILDILEEWKLLADDA